MSAQVGTVLAVWGPTGAPGRTTVAINLAAELALTGQRTLLIDADTYGGTVAASLGLIDEASGIAAACRLASQEKLTEGELARLVQRVSLGNEHLSVLTGITRPGRWPELATDRITAVLSACRGWFDVIVVDCGFNLEMDEEIASDMFSPRRNMATHAVLMAADTIIEVASADPIGISRFIRAHQDLRELYPDSFTPAANTLTVLNRVRPGLVGLGYDGQPAAALERFAGITPVAQLPHDDRALELALLKREPLCQAAPKSGVRKALAKLASSAELTEKLTQARGDEGESLLQGSLASV
jgi:MinD-like ATPase involved in chromosome partitioning or flagellar assembly